MTYIFNANYKDWEVLANFTFPEYTPCCSYEELKAFRSQKAKTRAKCPFCEKELSHCSMEGHVHKFHSKPNVKKPERADKLQLEVKQERRKEYMAIYNKEHKEEHNEKSREYYYQNKEERNTQYTCQCAHDVARRSKARHEKSVKHMAFINASK